MRNRSGERDEEGRGREKVSGKRGEKITMLLPPAKNRSNEEEERSWRVEADRLKWWARGNGQK
jgi:hypothetical protein